MVETLDHTADVSGRETLLGRKPSSYGLMRRLRPREIRSAVVLFVGRVAVLGLLIGGWQGVVELRLVDPVVSSEPKAVFTWLGNALVGSQLWTNLLATLEAAMLSFVLASVVGVTIGIMLPLLPRFEKLVDPYISAFNALPRVALAPLFVVAFGLSIQAKIALAFSVAVFILITSARAGVRSVDLEHVRLATVLGANKRQMFTKILLPVSIPSIFGGLRLAVIYSLLATLLAELLGSTNGIGQQLQFAAGVFRTNEVYGLIIVLAVTATLLNAATAALERRLLRWQAPSQ